MRPRRRTPIGTPPLSRFVLAGAMSLGLVGGVVGLVVGLNTYVPTAPFAVVEVGLPAALLGALLGVVVRTVLLVARRTAAGDAPGRRR